jgi:hypothetical protein
MPQPEIEHLVKSHERFEYAGFAGAGRL